MAGSRIFFPGSLQVALAVALLTQGCTAKPHDTATNAATSVTQTNQSVSKDSAAQRAQSIEDRTLIAVSKAIRKAHLTDRPDECLAYRFDGQTLKETYVIEVRENHSHAACGGDPETQPRLFTVRVNKKANTMSTDAGSPGQFHLLRQ